MINETDLMQKMEMFIHMNHRARAMHGGCGPKHMPHGPYGPGCRQGGPRHMPMPGMPVPPMPRPMLGRERLLVLIGKSEGGVRQKDLLEKVHIGAPAMSELINKLEDDGYIVRTVDPADRRATLLSLTEKGAARAAEVEDERALRFKSAFAALSDEEKEALSAILDKLLLPRA